ncbi:hypothetical protein [Bacteroides thetaiotaomicron]|nr:hypothetical protein [Bacteroides thetaiotaomicron]MCS2363343.1 hypothetical protein [Bacteroides thetaiotaomicron]
MRLVEAENIPPLAERFRKEGRKKRLSERRGNLFTMLSVSFFNVVKNKSSDMGDKLICITKNRKAMKIIILHDADARIEYLDVADHLIGSDIEEFLTRQGFSVNNITWLVTSADHIPVVYHKYDIDRKTGEATHTQREAELKDLTIHGQLLALQHREQDELKAALRKYGTEVDGGFEVHFEGEQPIVAGYLFDEPRDIVIDAARLDSDGNLSLLGEDKEVRDGQYDIEPSDIFGGQLDYVTSSIGAWMKEEHV